MWLVPSRTSSLWSSMMADSRICLGCRAAALLLQKCQLCRDVKGGLSFVDAHSGASICSPSRAALLTGREPRRTRVQHVLRPSSCGGLFPAEKTVAEALKYSGYNTAYVGKWHLGTVAPFHPTYQVLFDLLVCHTCPYLGVR